MLQELCVERERQRQRQKWRDIETWRETQRENRLSPPAFTQFHLPNPQEHLDPLLPSVSVLGALLHAFILPQFPYPEGNISPTQISYESSLLRSMF